MKRTESLLFAAFGGGMLVFGILLAGAFHPRAAQAGTADGGGGVVAVTGLNSSNQEILYLYDVENHRLAAYQVNASNRLALLAMRDITYDLKPQEFGKTDPPVKELKDLWKKHEENKEGGKEDSKNKKSDN